MGRFSAWVFAIALMTVVPAAASHLCGEQADVQSAPDKGGAKPADPKKQEHRPRKWWQGETKTELGVSDLQSAEIEQVFQSTVPKLEAFKQKVDGLEAALSKTTKDNKANLATLGQQLDELNAARGELYKTRTVMLYRMRGFLSDDQRGKLKALMERWDAERRKSNDDRR